ncbi:MAG TPA: PP0621 family protein [Paraburkholderia sp.]|nr:PP0621 family protein [Paraburkholderia sp.]
MRQILLLILLFIVGQWFFKSLRRSQHPRPGVDPRQGGPFSTNGAGASAGQSSGNSAGRGALPEPMVRCAECGVHAPRSESVSVGAQTFCCAEHARVYDARKTSQDRPAR